MTISYRVDTAPANAAFPLVVEFFLSDATGTDAFFIGSDIYETSDHSAGIKTITLTGVSIVDLPLDSLVATTTDGDGNTSELSAAANLTVV